MPIIRYTTYDGDIVEFLRATARKTGTAVERFAYQADFLYYATEGESDIELVDADGEGFRRGGASSYVEPPTITISGRKAYMEGEEGADIYYTLSGLDPSTGDTLYELPQELTEPVEIRAIAIRQYRLSDITVLSKQTVAELMGWYEHELSHSIPISVGQEFEQELLDYIITNRVGEHLSEQMVYEILISSEE